MQVEGRPTREEGQVVLRGFARPNRYRWCRELGREPGNLRLENDSLGGSGKTVARKVASFVDGEDNGIAELCAPGQRGRTRNWNLVDPAEPNIAHGGPPVLLERAVKQHFERPAERLREQPVQLVQFAVRGWIPAKPIDEAIDAKGFKRAQMLEHTSSDASAALRVRHALGAVLQDEQFGVNEAPLRAEAPNRDPFHPGFGPAFVRVGCVGSVDTRCRGSETKADRAAGSGREKCEECGASKHHRPNLALARATLTFAPLTWRRIERSSRLTPYITIAWAIGMAWRAM